VPDCPHRASPCTRNALGADSPRFSRSLRSEVGAQHQHASRVMSEVSRTGDVKNILAKYATCLWRLGSSDLFTFPCLIRFFLCYQYVAHIAKVVCRTHCRVALHYSSLVIMYLLGVTTITDSISDGICRRKRRGKLFSLDFQWRGTYFATGSGGAPSTLSRLRRPWLWPTEAFV
jgi:hypothetical protein